MWAIFTFPLLIPRSLMRERWIQDYFILFFLEKKKTLVAKVQPHYHRPQLVRCAHTLRNNINAKTHSACCTPFCVQVSEYIHIIVFMCPPRLNIQVSRFYINICTWTFMSVSLIKARRVELALSSLLSVREANHGLTRASREVFDFIYRK